MKLYKEWAHNDIDYSSPLIPNDDSEFNHVKALWDSYFGDGSLQETGDGSQPKWFIDSLKYAASSWGHVWDQSGGNSGFFPGGNIPQFDFSDETPGAGNGINEVNKSIDLSFSCISHSHTSWFPNYIAPSNANPFQAMHDVLYGHGSSVYFMGNPGGLTGGNPGNPVHRWNSFGMFANTQSGNHAGEYNLVMNNLVVGRRFRFDEDTTNTVYTINAIEIYNRWNYLDQDLWYQGNSDYNDQAYAKGQNGTTTLYDSSDPANIPNFIGNLVHPSSTASNRRITFRLILDKAIDTSVFDPTTNASTNTTTTHIQFLRTGLDDTLDKTSNIPAIWETEPKERIDLDIYYEASGAYPKFLTTSNISSLFSIGDKLSLIDTVQNNLDIIPGKHATIAAFDESEVGKVQIRNINYTNGFNFIGGKCRIYKKGDNMNYVELEVSSETPAGGKVWMYFERNTHKWGRTLDWFNAYSFGNGVESDTIRDDFNQIEVNNGVTASTTVGWQYEEERLKNGLIFSGIYNAKTSLNDLNQFIEAENITKEVNPSYGSIQKLHARDSDLVTFCEDKVLKILANKDALYNADENPNLISSQNVLGQVLPFVGDYGISTNPESFAKENFRSYFTDKRRGAVLRLSRDGLTPISLNGMKDWFRDNLKDDTDQRLIGCYDDHKSHYNLTPVAKGKTVVFNENSKGWVSFRSFVPEGGQSMNNDYFTFKNGKLYKHHVGSINTFYGGTSVDSYLTFVFNEAPSIVKSFTTLNYEGTQSEIIKRDDDDQYYNLQDKLGWSVEYIITDKEKGTVKEFIEKEGKWFNHIKGESHEIGYAKLDGEQFSYQGISTVSTTLAAPVLIVGADQLKFGCEDEYNNPAMQININTGNCLDIINPI